MNGSPVDVVQARLRGGERFGVTGASGWFGRTALDLLLRVLGPDDFPKQVMAFASRAKPVGLLDGTVLDAAPLSDLDTRPELTHLLHFAFLTRDRVEDLGIDGFVVANLALTDTVLRFVAAGTGLRGVAYASSGAASWPGSLHDNPYGVLKRIDELALRRACADVSASSCIARVFATSGAYMTKPERYALGEFVTAATRGEPLCVRAPRRVVRSYAAVEDVVALQLAAVLDPAPADELFESAGEEVEVEELAHRVVAALGCDGVDVRRDAEPVGGEDRYVGDPTRMVALAERFGLRLSPLDDQIRATAAALVPSGRG